ncbi:MAG: extracellular solute-binding protein [Rhodospirillaceae bacterium]|nr:extracellular solute-binding protein [Rhodospirillaceae bacterium]
MSRNCTPTTRRVALAGLSLLAGGALLALFATPDAAADEELTVTYMESGTYDVAARELATEFEKLYGVKVNVVAFPWAVLRQNNTTDLLTGTGQYDVMAGGYYLADVYSYFAPLTDFIQQSNYAKGMIPGLMEPGRSEWYKGQQIGIPFGIDAYGLMVNDEILAKAGVKPEFKTWDDVLAACTVIEKAVPDVACLSHPTGNPEQIGALFFSAYDGPYIDAAGAYHLDPGKAAAAAGLLPKLWSHLPPNGKALTFEESGQIFRDGRAALLVTWPSFVASALDDPDKSKIVGKWHQIAFPGPGFPWLSLWQEFIPNTTEDKETAFKWIRFAAGPDHAKDNYVKHSINSVWLATYEDPELAPKHQHQWPAMVEGFARAKNPPLSGEAQDFLTNTLVEVATGQTAPDAAIAKVNDAWKAIPVPEALLEAAKGAGFIAQ